MERQILIGIFRPKHADNLQKWSRIFRSEETETDLSIWIPNEISEMFGCLPFSYPKKSGNFGWNVNGKINFVSPNGNFLGKTGFLER